ncbi:hypothetical protein B0G84_1823 [Paraburkholderia sp. BL8N3]|nr:hypothetical protein [Paraburkholderia sp. BL8N3]TCK43487.1 hypothetical protein B0G84_1823 [Paraburkholderia sp. BL8N3]
MKTGSIYSASDKALFEALTQAKVTQADLRRLFLSRGMIVSRHTSREVLATHFSRLLHDYNDFQLLAKLFGTKARTERLASFRVVSKATMDNFEAAAHAVIERIQKEGDSATMSYQADDTLQISVRYKTMHFDKSEFKQIVNRNAVLTVEELNGVLVLRGPQNDKVDGWCRSLLSNVDAQIGGGLEIDEISLEAEPEASKRSKFFSDLTGSMTGFKRHDVTDVYVFKPKNKDTESEDSDEPGKKDGELGIHISRASLRGEGVLLSTELLGLVQRGFYISKIVWQATRNSEIDSDLYEFEAQFSEPETCTRFSYLPRGYYAYISPKQYAMGRTQCTHDEDRQLSKLIEAAARASLPTAPKSLTKKEPAAKNDKDKVV